MKKLLIVGSGDSVHLQNYLQLIDGYFDDILWISDKKDPDTKIKTLVTNFSLKNPLNRFLTVNTIRKAIKEFKPTVIHIHQANSFAYYTLAAAKQFSIPRILTAWGSDILVMPNKNYLLKNMVQYNLHQADAFTSDSTFMAAEMNRLAGEKLDITIANFGINMHDIITFPKENIIYSNRLHKKLYRIDKIIRAFKKFVDSGHADWKLVIAATGEETENLKALSGQLGIADKIQFAGWLDKKQNAEFYAKAKIFVSIPESDATAVSLLEAMANGCIPVLSDLPANKEWITEGLNGIIAKNTDSDFFAPVLQLNAQSVAAVNKKIISERATKEANRSKFIALYDKLLSKK